MEGASVVCGGVFCSKAQKYTSVAEGFWLIL